MGTDWWSVVCVACRALVKAQLMFAMPKAPFTGEFGW